MPPTEFLKEHEKSSGHILESAFRRSIQKVFSQLRRVTGGAIDFRSFIEHCISLFGHRKTNEKPRP
jgi:hypothetical protein